MKYKLLQNLPHKTKDPIKDILLSRGVEDIPRYLNPGQDVELDPENLINIKKGALALLSALEEQKQVLFIVDADQDGYASSAVLWLYCKKLFPESNLSFITHEGKQHGLEDHVDWLENTEQYDLIVCPDSSSMDFEYHKRLAENGKTVLVLDHHLVEEESKDAIIINNQLSKNYRNKSLCGAGVVYKFCQYLDTLTSNSYAPLFLDLVALAEIGDVMDLRELETRYYVKKGLSCISNPGFKALLQKQSFSISDTERPTPTDIAFYIAPLVNAIVRVGTKTEKDIMFLAFIDGNKKVKSTKRGAKPGDTETAAEQTARVASNARNRQNKLKEEAIAILEQRIIENDLLKNKLLILEMYNEDDIPTTLTGLIASHFVNTYSRPAFVVRKNKEGFWRGSARSNDSFDIGCGFKTFMLNSDLMDYCEGHQSAWGCSFHEKNYDRILQYVNQNLTDEMLSENTYYVDYIFDSNEDFSNIGEAVGEYNTIWGQGVSEPTIIVENLRVSKKDIFLMGENKNSVKFTINGIVYVKFKDDFFIQQLEENEVSLITVYGKFNRNEFAGKITTQLFISDYKIEDWYAAF